MSWEATFPAIGEASDFAGTAVSDLLLGNLAYEYALSGATTVRLSAGAGVSLNSLSGVVETDVGTGLFLDDVADHTEVSPAAQIGAGIQQKIAPNAVLGLNVSLGYAGGFETGNTRTGNLGVTDINPYKIDDVWRTDLTASLGIAF